MIVNLATCGGFGGERKVGDIVLASETFLDDIVERMGDADAALDHSRSTQISSPTRVIL